MIHAKREEEINVGVFSQRAQDLGCFEQEVCVGVIETVSVLDKAGDVLVAPQVRHSMGQDLEISQQIELNLLTWLLVQQAYEKGYLIKQNKKTKNTHSMK